MATQMTSARRGVATDEMKQIAKDEDVTLDWLIPKIASAVSYTHLRAHETDS